MKFTFTYKAMNNINLKILTKFLQKDRKFNLKKLSLSHRIVFIEFQMWKDQFPVRLRGSWWKEHHGAGQKVSPLWPEGCFCVNDRLADMGVESEAVWVANTRTPY